MVVRSHTRGPSGGAASPGRFASAEDLFKLWDDSGADAIEERLAAIAEMIKSWDWRAHTFDEHGAIRPRPASPAGTSTSEAPPVQQPPATICRVDAEPAFSPLNRHAPRGASRSTVQPVAFEEPASTPARRQTSHVHSPQFSAPPPEGPSPPAPPLLPSPHQAPSPPLLSDTASLPAIFEPATIVAEAVAAEIPPSPFAAATAPPVATTVSPPLDPVVDSLPVPPVDELETALEPSPRRRSKLIFELVAVAAVVVAVIIAIILRSAPGQTGGSSPKLTSTTSTSASHKAAIPVSSTAPARFTAATKVLDAANVRVTHVLAGGSRLSLTQVKEGVSPYLAALENFDFTLHFTAWPQSLQIPSEDLMFGNQVLVSWLQSLSSQNSATLSSWFTQLYRLGSQAETADNFFRKDLGLATTTSYP
jgi:hypothetical protein